MVKGIYHSAAGMIARQRQLEIIANNLANASTVGFKEEKLVFRNNLEESAQAHPSTQGEKFVSAERGVSRLPEYGSLQETGNPLDVAIAGEGFFVIETEAGLAYTRDGRFQLNAEGELVNLNGYRVMTENGTVRIPAGYSLRIRPDGEVILLGERTDLEQTIDRLRLVAFADPGALRPVQNGMFVTQQPPLELDEMRLEPGYLEESSVNLIEQMIEMIQVNKIYEASARAVHAQDSTLGKAVNEVGRA